MQMQRMHRNSTDGIEYIRKVFENKATPIGVRAKNTVRNVLFAVGMSIDAGLSVIAPRAAASRIAARLQLRAGYEAADYNRLTGPRSVSSLDADGELLGRGSRIRSFSREEGRNNPIAAGLRGTITRNVCGDSAVGQGMTVDPMVLDDNGEPVEAINKELKKLWEEFTRFIEYSGRWHFNDVVQLVQNCLVESGEVLAVMQERGAPGSRFPFSVEIVEPDRLPTSNDNFFTPVVSEFIVTGGTMGDAYSTGTPSVLPEKAGESNEQKHRVQHGIEYDHENQIVAFHVLKDHPGSVMQNADKFQTRRLKKEKVIHYFLPNRAEQTRGVTAFVSALNTLSDVSDAVMWELIAAKAQSAFGIHFGGSATPNIPYPSTGGTVNNNPPTDVNGNPVTQVQPGMITVGPTKAEFYTATRPGGTFAPFVEFLMRMCGMSVGVGYSATSRDYSQGAYSALRQEDNEDARTYRMYQGLLTRHFIMRIYREFVRLCVVKNLAKGISNSEYLKDPERFGLCVVNVPGRSHINPLQEIQAEAVAVKNGFKTLDEVLNVSGMEPAERLKSLARYKKIAEKANLMLGWIDGEVKPPINAPNNGTAANGGDEDAEPPEDQADANDRRARKIPALLKN